MSFKYLHESEPNMYYLDHRLAPEVRAMLCAMASRLPDGGIRQRYAQIVAAAGDEDLLLTTIPPKVREFFDTFVGQYGHCLHPLTMVCIAKPDLSSEWITIQNAVERWLAGEELFLATYSLLTKEVYFERPISSVTKDYAGLLVDMGYLCTPDHIVYSNFLSRTAKFVLAQAQTLLDESVIDGQIGQTITVCQLGADDIAGPYDQPPILKIQTLEEITTTYYNGKVYCFMMPERMLVVKTDRIYITGNSSVMELTGTPSVFLEGISEWSAFNMFDNPLVAGQQVSTRAVKRRPWPMAEEVKDNKVLQDFHHKALKIYEEEVIAWQDHLSSPENREALGIQDKEPFRPAFDRARWAIPFTISTAMSMTTNPRVAKRLVANLYSVGSPAAEKVEKLYKEASFLYQYNPETKGKHNYTDISFEEIPYYSRETKIFEQEESLWVPEIPVYLPPSSDMIRFSIYCSLAALRDWHRHRTMLPMCVEIPLKTQTIHPLYKSLTGQRDILLQLQQDALKELQQEVSSNKFLLQHAFLFGNVCLITSRMNHRDFTYTMLLRRDVHGANFEYKSQAAQLLGQVNKLGTSPPYKLY